jgi:hypothetical protein
LSVLLADPEKAPPEIARSPPVQKQSVAPGMAVQLVEMYGGSGPASGIPGLLRLSTVVSDESLGELVPPQLAVTIADDIPRRSHGAKEARMRMILSPGAYSEGRA